MTDGKYEQEFKLLPRDSLYRTSPWTRRKGPKLDGLPERHPTNHICEHVASYLTDRLQLDAS